MSKSQGKNEESSWHEHLTVMATHHRPLPFKKNESGCGSCTSSHAEISQIGKDECLRLVTAYEWLSSDLDYVSMPSSFSFKRFVQHLDDKTYWITGKPGSGKSTLMKFIRHHTETTDILKAWAGDDDIVQAAFYFWNSGARIHFYTLPSRIWRTINRLCKHQSGPYLMETSALCDNMRRKLTSRGLGLLGIPSNNNVINVDHDDDIDGLEVQHLHRSVRDYIEEPEVWRRTPIQSAPRAS